MCVESDRELGPCFFLRFAPPTLFCAIMGFRRRRGRHAPCAAGRQLSNGLGVGRACGLGDGKHGIPALVRTVPGFPTDCTTICSESRHRSGGRGGRTDCNIGGEAGFRKFVSERLRRSQEFRKRMLESNSCWCEWEKAQIISEREDEWRRRSSFHQKSWCLQQ